MNNRKRLTDKQTEKVFSQEPYHSFKCPVCTSDQFGASHIYLKNDDGSVSGYAQEVSMLGRDMDMTPRLNGPNMIPVVCHNCGFVLHFSSAVIARKANEH